MARKKAPKVVPYKIHYVFEIKDGELKPNRCPKNGEVIRLGRPNATSIYKSLVVDSHWFVHTKPAVHDTIVVWFYGLVKTFQIKPMEYGDDWYGEFVEIKVDKFNKTL